MAQTPPEGNYQRLPPRLRKKSPNSIPGYSQASKKSSKHVKFTLLVPETDTGREVENTQGREITLSKELGKMAP